jgi:hypothetical protein
MFRLVRVGLNRGEHEVKRVAVGESDEKFMKRN